jgi:methylmalonyl-CoA/ethylmalonyl-CoA epimerase
MASPYLRLDHVGIAVQDLDAALAQYEGVLGFAVERREVHEGEQVEIAFLRVGESCLELISPHGEGSRLKKHIEKRGEGIHHLCFAVQDLAGRMAALKAAGAEMLDAEPRQGAHGTRVAFLHPRAGRGVLVELVEEQGAGGRG